MLRTFKINDYLELRLEENHTNIYVKGKLFRQCKYLLLNIHMGNIEKYEGIESIDEAVKTLDHTLERSHDGLIPPETEFWGHCSNLQVWAESDYDTRLIHSNLVFPLLERLYQAGDKIATKVFKEEIAKRYESGYRPVIEYLKKNNYLKIFSSAERSAIGIGPKFFHKDGRFLICSSIVL
ncbi:MAG: hypothetical protein KAX18_03305 [Candidatus Lokiarchaeota archaeon]|nr:hypothetical protein [Candidatus Lokiarchaeota archaeon]